MQDLFADHRDPPHRAPHSFRGQRRIGVDGPALHADPTIEDTSMVMKNGHCGDHLSLTGLTARQLAPVSLTDCFAK